MSRKSQGVPPWYGLDGATVQRSALATRTTTSGHDSLLEFMSVSSGFTTRSTIVLPSRTAPSEADEWLAETCSEFLKRDELLRVKGWMSAWTMWENNWIQEEQTAGGGIGA